MDLTYKIVRRLFRDDEVKFSRNQNFEAFEDPQVKRAARIWRHLSSVEDDLLAAHPAGDVRLEAVEREGGRIVVRLTFKGGGGKRVSYLTRPEWALLLENDRVTDILRSLLKDATDDTRDLMEDLLEAAQP